MYLSVMLFVDYFNSFYMIMLIISFVQVDVNIAYFILKYTPCSTKVSLLIKEYKKCLIFFSNSFGLMCDYSQISSFS